MSQIVTQVDAFTSTPFAGNPAAVCILSEMREDQWLQNVASEMNLAETAFLLKQEDGFQLRWFTPVVEVDLCGHATLASAHVLWEAGYLRSDEQARFHTRSGLLTALRQGSWIELDFPQTPAEVAIPPEALLQALGVEARYVGKNQFDYLVEIASEKIVRALTPNFSLLATVPARGVIVTSRADSSSPYDFVSRFFGPQVGVNEDPVTGSAHCCLAPYWAPQFGREHLIGFQASKRGGEVRVRLEGDRVRLSGQAVTVLRGSLL